MNIPPLLLQLSIGRQSSPILWLITGITFLALSFLIPIPTIAAMGVAAILTGIAAFFFPDLASQMIIWVVLFILLAVLSRLMTPRTARGLKRKTKAKVLEEIPAGGIGQVHFQGCPWMARCQNPDIAIPANEIVRIVDRDGTTLIVLPADAANRNSNISY